MAKSLSLFFLLIYSFSSWASKRIDSTKTHEQRILAPWLSYYTAQYTTRKLMITRTSYTGGQCLLNVETQDLTNSASNNDTGVDNSVYQRGGSSQSSTTKVVEDSVCFSRYEKNQKTCTIMSETDDPTMQVPYGRCFSNRDSLKDKGSGWEMMRSGLDNQWKIHLPEDKEIKIKGPKSVRLENILESKRGGWQNNTVSEIDCYLRVKVKDDEERNYQTNLHPVLPVKNVKIKRENDSVEYVFTFEDHNVVTGKSEITQDLICNVPNGTKLTQKFELNIEQRGDLDPTEALQAIVGSIKGFRLEIPQKHEI